MAISDSDYLVTTARDLGAAMKHFRTGAGVTQADAAEAMGIGQPYLSSLEGESSVARGPEFRIRLEWCPEGIERWGLGRGHSGPGAPGGRLQATGVPPGLKYEEQGGRADQPRLTCPAWPRFRQDHSRALGFFPAPAQDSPGR